MKLFFAGATHESQSRAREQIRVTLNTRDSIDLLENLPSHRFTVHKTGGSPAYDFETQIRAIHAET
jgi:hypothetical protein